MGVNIEIKAKLGDPDVQRRLAAQISDTPCERIEQIDTFFNVPRGRLKLRQTDPNCGELIYYNRSDQAGPKKSDYSIVPAQEPAALGALLSAALGVCGTVRKTRYLYRAGPTRIHIDDVTELGWFLELEVVLTGGMSEAEGRVVADRLMRELGIQPDDLVACAYVDLLTSEAGTAPGT